MKVLESTDSNEVLEEAIDLLNTIIDDVVKISEMETNVPDQTDLPPVTEVPHAEVRSEEVVLEGKPGEEEIIGLISESDVEMDVECSKVESEMVVMQSGGITLKVKAESLQSSPSDSPGTSPEKLAKVENDKHLDDDGEIEFRPPTPDPNFTTQPPVSKGRELSGLCCIM